MMLMDRAVNRTFSISVNGIVKIPICFKTAKKKKSKTKCQMLLSAGPRVNFSALKDALKKTVTALTDLGERKINEYSQKLNNGDMRSLDFFQEKNHYLF